MNTAIFTYSGILCNHWKEWRTPICFHMQESPRYIIKLKKKSRSKKMCILQYPLVTKDTYTDPYVSGRQNKKLVIVIASGSRQRACWGRGWSVLEGRLTFQCASLNHNTVWELSLGRKSISTPNSLGERIKKNTHSQLYWCFAGMSFWTSGKSR